MSRNLDLQRGLTWSGVVKGLIIANLAVWLVGQVLLERFILKNEAISDALSLVPGDVLFGGRIWQLFTYMFLHTADVTHIVFNMLMLFFFGAELEQRWGKKFFLLYYMVCGVGAAVIYVTGMALSALVFKTGVASLGIPVQGASGAIFGLLLAYGLLFGDRVVYFFMVFPMKARIFVLLMGLVELASLITTSTQGSEVAYLAHLGGLASGFIFLKIWNWRQRQSWNKKLHHKNKNRTLKLVVDNDKDKPPSDPKYWN